LYPATLTKAIWDNPHRLNYFVQFCQPAGREPGESVILKTLRYCR
jgi:hypothetical protein